MAPAEKRSDSLQRLRAPLAAAFVIVLAIVWVAIGIQIKTSRDAALQSTLRHGNNLTQTVAAHFSVFAKSIDMWLRHLRSEWTADHLHIGDQVMESKATLLESYAFEISIIGADGTIAYSSLPSSHGRVNFSDQEFFRYYKDSWLDEFRISDPVANDALGEAQLRFTRPIHDRRGNFAGVIVFSIAPRELNRVYAAIDLGHEGVLTLRRLDGTVLARTKDYEKGAQQPGGLINLAGDPRESGSFVRRSVIDGIERIFSFRKLPEYGLVMVVGQPTEVALEDYYGQRRAYLLDGAVVTLLLLVLMLATNSRLGREIRAGGRLRKSEERFRSLTRLSSDIYWEQDRQFRFTTFTGTGSDSTDSARFNIVLGKTRWEAGYVNVSAEKKAQHKAALEARQPFHDLELCRFDEAGAPHWISASGEPVFDESGAFAGYRGVAKDITERKRAGQMRDLEHAVSAALAGAESAVAGLQEAMRIICESQKWMVGRYFRVDDQAGVLRFAGGWSTQDAGMSEFLERSRDLTYARGEGLSGRVWQSAEPLWVADVGNDPRVSAVALARGAVIRAALVIPATADGRIVGVCSFSSAGIRQPDEQLLAAFRMAGGQIGQFLERKRREEELRESEARFRSLTKLTSDLYWEQDRDFRFTRAAGTGAIANSEFTGKTRWELPVVGMTEAAWREHRAVLEARRPFRDFVNRLRDAAGQVHYVSVNGEPVFDERGEFCGYRGTAKDVTVAMRREEELRRFRAAMDVSADLILLVDPATMLYIDVNEAACRALGYSREELLALGPADLFSISRAELAESYRRLIEGDLSGAATEGWYRRRDGSVFPVESYRRAVPSESGHVVVAVARDITERRDREEELRKSNERFNILAQGTNDVIRDHDLVGDTLWWNENIETMLGYRRDEIAADADVWYQGIDPRDSARVRSAFRALLDSNGTVWCEEYRFRRGDGTFAHVLDRGFVIRSETGRAVRAISAMSDISARKEAERHARQRELQQSVIAAFGMGALANTDLEELMRHAVTVIAETLDIEFCSLLEIAPDGESLVLKAGVGWDRSWTGRPLMRLDARTAMSEVVRTQEPVVVEDFEQDRRFARSELSARHGIRSFVAVAIPQANGVYGTLGIQARHPRAFGVEQVDFLRSVANTLAAAIERKRAEDRLTKLAQFDTVTGLPNRVLFRDRLEQVLVQGARNGWLVGVMFIDLDRFKVVNDTLGHSFGDRLLVQVGTRLAEGVRTGDTVGRLSGDEFAVVLSDLARADDAALVAQKLLDGLSVPFDLDGHKAYVTGSIGIAVYPADGANADALLRNADTAMYRAKAKGRNCCQFYMPEMNARAIDRLELETDLRGALERDEFLLHYQPKVTLGRDQITGFEALLRWKHPGKGLVSPAEFIPLLEETGLIVPVGEWVLREVCRQMNAWQDAGLAPPPVAVNLSARQFQQRDLDERVRAILSASGVNPALIEFEITESLLMHDAEAAALTLRALKDAGIGVSVDDFGTGYSSLSYLRRFPLDALKIDRSFISDIVANADDAAITLAIIRLAHSLKLSVVAEGVETQAQLDFLAAHGCDSVQGYFYSRPVDAEECARMLRGERRLGAARKPGGIALVSAH